MYGSSTPSSSDADKRMGESTPYLVAVRHQGKNKIFAFSNESNRDEFIKEAKVLAKMHSDKKLIYSTSFDSSRINRVDD
jgi:hypothetical protein